MTLDPRLTSIEGRALLAFAMSIDIPDPTPEQAAGPKMDPLAFARGLKQLGRECEQLIVAAAVDDIEYFIVKYDAARPRAAAIEVMAQRNRRQWAVAALELNACLQRRGRIPGSSHLALVEWCREVLFAIAVGANIERLAAAAEDGIDILTSEDDLRTNWQTVRSVLAALDPIMLHDFVGAIDAELSVLERRTPRYLVSLKQMAAIVGKGKRTLETRKTKGLFPMPDVEGGSGKSDEWDWNVVRPILEKEFSRQLPEVFPADRFSKR